MNHHLVLPVDDSRYRVEGAIFWGNGKIISESKAI
jgi:hypothetical protein